LITLVLGGVRSGKSRYAQQLGTQQKNVLFIATASPCDDEMRAKIDRHKADRPAECATVESGAEAEAAIRRSGDGHGFIILDCLTILVAELIQAEGGDSDRVLKRIEGVCAALKSSTTSSVVVSNEVGSGVVPAYPLGRQFRDLLGEANQMMARAADNVLYMVAGLPIVLKGRDQLQ